MTKGNPLIGYKRRMEIIFNAFLRDLEKDGPLKIEDLIESRGLNLRMKDLIDTLQKIEKINMEIQKDLAQEEQSQAQKEALIQQIISKIQGLREK